MSNSNLEALFGSLRGQPRNQSDSQPSAAPATASAAWAVNPANMPNSPPPSTYPPPQNANARSLLSLLNYGATKSSTQSTPAAQLSQPQPTGGSRNVSADLLAMLQKGSGSASADERDEAKDVKQKDQEVGEEDALRNFLRTHQATRSPRGSATGSQQPEEVEKPATAEEVVDESTSVSPPKKQEPLFTYSNPFLGLQSSRKATPSQEPPQPKASPSPIFTVPSIERAESPSEFPHRKMLTPRSASAKVERLARETSVKSTGTPEPNNKEESPQPEKLEMPIRTNKTKVESEEAEQPTASKAAISATVQEKAAIASEEVAWEDASKESPEAAADEWEDAEESPSPPIERPVVPVYNFPIRPFISLTLNLDKTSDVEIQADRVMEISRLKKDFDQLDRSLAAATTKYIAYALVKNGGMRIIRQDDGSDRQVFKNSHDRVFNVSFCTTASNVPAAEHQAILGTGVSGAVYYATVSKEGNDLFEKNELDTEILSFPPWPPADENSAGGVLKTRAKKSSRHPEYFAIGRGKSIHLIWPATAMHAKYGITESGREVDMELLYKERNLQIATGKAGKDFSFSEDDTLIVSLDKTGRLRFWDIRSLTDDSNATVGKIEPVKVDTPLLSLMTASPAEKSWPTSVLLIDKARPYSKGGAQRYVLVGLRQNHTLQLWDIALGKAVQELNFPHDSETDGVCSVNYHPASGFIVVGHPTRNSIFFIHLSAPRYAVSSSTDQATYVHMIASKDPEAPKPDSTACMSGIREISFASKGQLRSVELLPLYKPAKSGEKSAQDALFELYIVHSKGVTCLTVTKEDLGLDAGSKVVNGIDAVPTGVVTSKELKLGSVIEESSSRARSPPEEPVPTPAKSSKKKNKKAQQAAEVAPAEVFVDAPVEEAKVPQPTSSKTNGTDALFGDALLPPKESKKSKKKAAQEVAAVAKSPPRTASPMKPEAVKPTTAAEEATRANGVEKVSSFVQPLSEPPAPQVQAAVQDNASLDQTMAREFKKELNALYKDIQTDRIAQDSTATARQEAVLRVVSQTLSSNVEKSMATIIAAQIEETVLPSLTTITAQAVQNKLGDAVAKSLQQAVPQELTKSIPGAVQSALTGPKFAQSIQENIAQKLGKSLEAQVIDVINRNVNGAVAAAAEKAASAVETRMVPLFQKLEEDRRADYERLEKFNNAIAGMVETLKSMSETQVAFQNQILLDRQQLSAMAGSDPHHASTAKDVSPPAAIAQPVPIQPKTAQELERDQIEAMMNEGRYEDASIKWLHSQYQVELFDSLFVGFTPEYLATDVSALVAFSIAVTVSKRMETNLENRLEWVKGALEAVDYRVRFEPSSNLIDQADKKQDPEIAELSHQAPQLLDGFISKIEELYMSLAEQDTANPIIKRIPPIARMARSLRTALKEQR